MLFDAPPGYRVFETRVRIGSGPERWDFARRETLGWGIKTRSGFTFAAGEALPPRDQFSATGVPSVSLGEPAWLALGLGPFRLREPIRVSRVVDEPNRQGFAYETRPGHQLSGEELFVVERDGDDTVWLTVRTVSRPARGWGWARPVLALGQRMVRARYLRALTGPVS